MKNSKNDWIEKDVSQLLDRYNACVRKNGHMKRYTPFIKRRKRSVFFMKGYIVDAGYMGYVDGTYILFANEEDYREYFED